MNFDRSPANRPPWWKVSRGEWLVIGQLALMVLVFFGPRTFDGWRAWASPIADGWSIAGCSLMIVGGTLMLAGIFRIGRGLTPLPYPKDGAELVQTGPYALVRHPMYCGGFGLALGWALFVQGWLTLGYVAVLFVFLDAKSRREERWLSERYPAYASYQQRVRKLIPFVY